jgi:conjugative relaxase-like TrwC/TraI family protein
MLRITQQYRAADAKRYYASADYYSEGQEVIGSWGGKGAERLGLKGVVDKESFERLCDNLSPLDGKQLTARTRADRTVLYDFTWSVPKSVSLLYAMTGDEQLVSAFRSAVDETMQDIEAEMKTRVRRNDKDEDRVSGNVVWAEFIHKTSRPVDGVPDPQLHIHTAVFNATFDAKEQRWKAGQFRDLKRDAPYFQAAMRVRLAGKLQEMGFAIDRKRDDFEIAGIPASTIAKFSRRTDEIEKIAAEKGITDPKRKAELGAETREKKNKDLTWEQLWAEWKGRLTDKERQAMLKTYRTIDPNARQAGGEREAVDYALEHSFTRETVVPERKLLTEALKRGLGSVTVQQTARELARRPLIRGDVAGRAMATSQGMVELEARLIAFAREGRGRFLPLGDPGRPCSREWFNDGQKAAVRHVLGMRDAVGIVRGVAGTGKTTLEQEIGEALAEAGVRVVALAPTTGATRVLREEAGFDNASTVAGFLKNAKMHESARNGVVLVDEASLLGTRDMMLLFGIAKDIGARVVLVGDRKQHRSVAAGEPLKLLEERAGLPVAEVTEILRQSGDYRKAAKALSDGKTAEGFAELEKLGWIKEVAGKERGRQLAEAYLAAIKERKKGGKRKSALVVSPTHAEGARITATIRAGLKAEGKLKQERTLASWVPAQLTTAQKSDATYLDQGCLLQFHQNAPGHKNGSRLVVTEGMKLPLPYADRFEVYRPTQLTLAVGERIRITANGKTKDGKHRLDNGALFTVQGFTPQGDPIIDHNWVVSRDFGHLAHGYVVTSHASQGKTVDKVFIGMSSESFAAANQRSAYVSITRGKEQAVIFTDNKQELLKAVQRPDEPMSATEFVQVRRRPPLRQRLNKHLAFMRRLNYFNRTHESRVPDPQRTPPLEREHHHVR